jgi:2-polyprenyl-3-methyl-5-hydroxy-6-metoxy-1,4-benzoquinol methylase
LTKVICISHLEDFILHHLPNVYLERLGCSESDFQLQVNTLLEIAGSERTAEALFQTEKPKPFEKWNKSYYELCSKEILDLVPTGAKKVLSVGSGVGLAETQLAALGLDITCIPLDSIVSACTKAKGFRMSPSNFPRAFDFLAQDKFDCILLLRIIQHLREPTHILYKLQNLLEPHGIMIITAPNFNYYPTWVNTLGFRCKWWWSVKFDRSGLHFTTIRNLKRWIINSNMKVRNVLFQNRKKKKFRNKEFTIPVKGISAKEIILTAHEKK